LKAQKILIVVLWPKALNPDEKESIHKEYLPKVSPESEDYLKDALEHLGIIINIIEYYWNAIKKITSKNYQRKCAYFTVWVINGPPYEDLPPMEQEKGSCGCSLVYLKFSLSKTSSLLWTK